MQERLLSPRTLYFGSSILFWECATQSALKLRPLGDARIGTWDADNRRYWGAFAKFTSWAGDSTSALLKAPWMAWDLVVYYYTSCALTKWTDKLIAISGIIQFIQHQRPLTSIAGPWKENLREELMWCTSSPVERPQEYQTPSWSWAAVNSTIENWFRRNIVRFKLERSIDWLITVMLADSTSENPDMNGLGPVSDGFLIINGPFSSWPTDLRSSRFYWDTNDPLPAQLWVLEMVHSKLADGSKPDSDSYARNDIMIGLVLVPAQRNGQDVWRRVGIVLWANASQLQVNPQRLDVYII